MSTQEELYNGWTDDHAMTTRASWYDEEQSVSLEMFKTDMDKITLHDMPAPPRIQKNKKHVRRLKKAVVHRDFNLGKRKINLPEREFCIAPACDGECERCNRVTVDELERVRENGLPCPFTGEVCRRSVKVICEFRCNRYLKIQREWMKRYGFLEDYLSEQKRARNYRRNEQEWEEDESEVEE